MIDRRVLKGLWMILVNAGIAQIKLSSLIMILEGKVKGELANE